MKVLDLFCGLGGWSKGFHAEGFDCYGVDIVDVGYPYRLELCDIRTLDIEWVKQHNFDVIVGSPPCRDFSLFAKRFGSTWKNNPPNPLAGLELINIFLRIAQESRPKYWLMENVPGLCEHLPIKPRVIKCLGPPEKQQMRRCLWGNFPDFFIPFDPHMKVKRYRPEVGRPSETNQAKRAEIPFCVANTIAQGMKTGLTHLHGNFEAEKNRNTFPPPKSPPKPNAKTATLFFVKCR